MKNERYYYSILNADEKEAYRLIYHGIQKRALNIVVPLPLSRNQVQDIYLKVLYDTPIFYYIDQTVIRTSGVPGRYILLPDYLYRPAEIQRINQDIQNVLRRIDVKARTMLDNEFRLEKYIHDSVVKSVAYDYESLKRSDCYSAHSIVGVFLDKKAVCEGIAKAFKLLCNQYGMKCIVVLGQADLNGEFGKDTGHAWNLVRAGNGSYYVDATWDNMYNAGVNHISYDYFNVTTQDILKDHRPEGVLPICTDTGLNYFHCTKSFVSTYTELVALMQARCEQKEIIFKVRPTGTEFRSMDEVKAKTFAAFSQVKQNQKKQRRAKILFNDAQWIGKILFL